MAKTKTKGVDAIYNKFPWIKQEKDRQLAEIAKKINENIAERSKEAQLKGLMPGYRLLPTCTFIIKGDIYLPYSAANEQWTSFDPFIGQVSGDSTLHARPELPKFVYISSRTYAVLGVEYKLEDYDSLTKYYREYMVLKHSDGSIHKIATNEVL